MNQSAFSDPAQAVAQYQDYLLDMQNMQNWPSELVIQLVEYSDLVYDDATGFTVNIFRTDSDEAAYFWKEISEKTPGIIEDFFGFRPSNNELSNYDGYLATIGSAETAAIAESDFYEDVVTGHLDDELDKAGKASESAIEKIEKWAPWVGGFLAIYMVYKILK